MKRPKHQEYHVECADLPLPDIVRRGRKYRFPFDRLEIGKCFIVVGMARNTLGPYKRYAETHLSRVFVTQKIQRGIAVWRRE